MLINLLHKIINPAGFYIAQRTARTVDFLSEK